MANATLTTPDSRTDFIKAQVLAALTQQGFEIALPLILKDLSHWVSTGKMDRSRADLTCQSPVEWTATAWEDYAAYMAEEEAEDGPPASWF